MDDLISRQAAIDVIYKEWDGISYDGDGYHIASECERVLDELPSVQPRKGKWTYADGTPVGPWAGYGVYCSACKEKSEYASNYCGMCGADMRGDSDE